MTHDAKYRFRFDTDEMRREELGGMRVAAFVVIGAVVMGAVLAWLFYKWVHN